MTLIDIGNGTYVNIDLALSVYKEGDKFHLDINDSYKTHYHISEETYNNILLYLWKGKSIIN